MRYISPVILFILVVLVGCESRGSSPGSLWGAIPVTEFTPELTPWIDSVATDEVEDILLGRIGSMVEDANHHVYISDLISQSIKKFDPNGRFIQTIGRRGRGAGEFINLKNFTLTGDGSAPQTITVTDEGNRVIAEFSTDGKLLHTYQIPTGVEYPKGPFVEVDMETRRGYLFLYKLHKGFVDYDCLFHFFEADFSQKTGCFGSFQDLPYSGSDVYNYLTEARPGNFIVTSDHTIFYTPYLYDGFIYTYAFDEERQEWVFSGTLEGLVYETKPIDENAEPFEYRLSYKRKSFYGQVNNKSLGLFQAPEGLYHFTKIKSMEGGYWFGVERYDNQGKLREYIRFTETISDSLTLYSSVLHRGASGLFYLLGVDSHGLPEIKKLRLESVPNFTHNSSMP